MTRVIRCGVATFLCLAALGAPRVFAQEAFPTVDPCLAPNVRNDVRPGAGGPPLQIHVGVRLIDLLEISDGTRPSRPISESCSGGRTHGSPIWRGARSHWTISGLLG